MDKERQKEGKSSVNDDNDIIIIGEKVNNIKNIKNLKHFPYLGWPYLLI
jgi:hypothetical protein